MRSLQSEETRRDRAATAYVVDRDLRIVYVNDRPDAPKIEYGTRCYLAIGNRDSQCEECPLRPENQSRTIHYDYLQKEWVSVTATPIQWPGVGDCHIILTDSIESENTNFFQSAAAKADYDELLELNYKEDTYTVIYHGERKSPVDKSTGAMSPMVTRMAQRVIHPDDRERFKRFWLLDHVGEPGVPEAMLRSRHGEFRKLRPDGSYEWVQQLFMPVRQSGEDSVTVMSLFNAIDQADPDIAMDLAGQLLSGDLYNRQSFFETLESFNRNYPGGKTWCLVSIDIENLKLFNEWYGREAGDKLITGIYNYLSAQQDWMEIVAGYFGNDDFCLLMPYHQEWVDRIYRDISAMLDGYTNKVGFLPAIGVYVIRDRSLPVYAMFDRAELARSHVRGNYRQRVQLFDDDMLDSLESRVLLHSDVQKGLREGEFTFYLQPKCNMENGKVVGAEALARWISPEKGLISPGVFIPFLERTGFITELDAAIWEAVCKWQRSNLDRGVPAVPVSVNVSRADMYAIDVPAYFRKLMEKYDLDPRLVELEITESFFAEDQAYISSIVAELRDSGFRILMDDFGSGYSSLNMLRDIEADVLKVDMRFLKFDGKNATKGIGILEAIRKMAQLMGLDIIVEGVETAEEKSFLLKMGCGYGQGYYFYRPMPREEFEQLVRDGTKLDDEGFRDKEIKYLVLKDLLNEDMFSEIMIDNMLGAVVFLAARGDRISVVRYNENYAQLLGNPATGETDLRTYLGERDYEKLRQMLERARDDRNNGAEVELCRVRADGTNQWVHLRTFFLREQDDRAVYYSSVNDVTDIHRQNENLIHSNETLRFLTNDMPGGYYCHETDPEARFIHISDRFLGIVGYTRQEIRDQFDDSFRRMLHPDDRELLGQSMAALEKIGGNYSCSCRIRSKNGYIRVTNQSRLVQHPDAEFFQGILLYDVDYYAQSDDDGSALAAGEEAPSYNASLMPCGIYQAEADGEHRFSYVSDSMLALLGYSREAFHERFHCIEDLISEEDMGPLLESLNQQARKGPHASAEFRVRMADGSLKWVYARGRLTADTNGKRWFYVCIVDYDPLKHKLQEREWRQEKYRMLAEIPGMLTYDYDPAHDLLTIELAQADGTLRTIRAERYLEKVEDQTWLAPEDREEQRKSLRKAMEGPMSGITGFRACITGDGVFVWYHVYFKSVADQSGKVYRIVGRAEKAIKED